MKMTRQELKRLNELFDRHDENVIAIFEMYDDDAYIRRVTGQLWDRVVRRVKREMPALDPQEFCRFLGVRWELFKADTDFEIELMRSSLPGGGK
jgi:hypothetical protein